MTHLEECRAEIDRVDKEICALYERRMRIVEGVVQYKKEHGLPVLQPEREDAVLQRVEDTVTEAAYRPGVRRVFETLMEVSRSLQNGRLDDPWKVAVQLSSEDKPSLPAGFSVGFQGEEGSFSETALLQAFGPDTPRHNYPRFVDVFEALQRGEIGCAVLPIENSSTGGVNEVYDLLHEYDFFITGEEYVTVRQHLLGLPGASLGGVREVRSHPQALEQSRGFLSDHPAMHPTTWLNTAAAALSVAEQGDASVAAIASDRAASLYGLEILASDINDRKDNTTRFVLVERSRRISTQDDKVSVVFSLDDKSGTLYKLLGYFFEQSVNLVKIESRPLTNSRWKYFLYVDLQGNVEAAPVAQALHNIEIHADYFQLLGSYRSKEAQR